jgi:hypothetical protein
VLSRNLENEEAKARYRAVKMHPQWVVTPGKQTNKQTNKQTIFLATNFTTWYLIHPTAHVTINKYVLLDRRGLLGICK